MNKGFGLNGILIVVLIIFAVGTAGMYLMKNNDLNNQEIENDTTVISDDDITTSVDNKEIDTDTEVDHTHDIETENNDDTEHSHVTDANQVIEEFCTKTQGEFHTSSNFTGIAQSVKKCGDEYKISEIGYYSESRELLVDSEGNVLDECQGLFFPEGCERLDQLTCEELNICASYKLDCSLYVKENIFNQQDCDYLNSLRD